MKLSRRRFRLVIRKKFSTQWVAKHWNRLPRVPVTAPSLSELKKHLGNTLRHRWDNWGVLCRGRRWTQWSWWIPSNSAYSMIPKSPQEGSLWQITVSITKGLRPKKGLSLEDTQEKPAGLQKEIVLHIMCHLLRKTQLLAAPLGVLFWTDPPKKQGEQ